jgi:hypothetical protein
VIDRPASVLGFVPRESAPRNLDREPALVVVARAMSLREAASFALFEGHRAL